MSAKIIPRQIIKRRLTKRESNVILGNIQTIPRLSVASETELGGVNGGKASKTTPEKYLGNTTSLNDKAEDVKDVPPEPFVKPVLNLRQRRRRVRNRAGSFYSPISIHDIHSGSHQQHKFIIPWDSKFRRWWDFVAVCFVLYLSYKIPLGIAFDDSWHFPKWIDTVMDIFFAIDIFLNFRTGFLHYGHHVTDPALIREHYLQSWFAVDVLASIPFEVIFGGMLDKSARKSLKIFKWLKFPKLLRLGRFLRYLKKNFKYYTLFLLSCTMLFCVHLLGCVWASIVNPCYEVGDCSSTQLTSYYVSSIYIALLMLFNVANGTQFVATISSGLTGNRTIVQLPDWIQYTDSSAFFAMLGIYILSAVSIIAGFALVIQVIAEVVTFSLHRSENHRRFYSKVEKIMQELINSGTPEPLLLKVQQYYDHIWVNNKSGMTSKTSYALTDVDLSKSLRKEIALAMHGAAIKRITLFDSCSEDCVFDIAMRLNNNIYLPSEVVFNKGDTADALYIVREGVVKFILPPDLVEDETNIVVLEPNSQQEEAVKYLGAGSFFGELALLTNTSRLCTVLSHSISELSELSREDFHEVMTRFPELNQNVIEEVADEYPQLADQILLYSPKAASRKVRMNFSSRSSSSDGVSRNEMRKVIQEQVDQALEEKFQAFETRILSQIEKLVLAKH